MNEQAYCKRIVETLLDRSWTINETLLENLSSLSPDELIELGAHAAVLYLSKSPFVEDIEKCEKS